MGNATLCQPYTVWEFHLNLSAKISINKSKNDLTMKNQKIPKLKQNKMQHP